MKTLFKIMPYTVALALLSMCFGIMGTIRPTDKSARYLAELDITHYTNTLEYKIKYPVHWAALTGDCEYIESFFERYLTCIALEGDRIFDVIDTKRRTPLHMAALRKSNEECINKLLLYGANKYARDTEGSTPGDLATLQGFVGYEKMLK
jgi:hypothetical protein